MARLRNFDAVTTVTSQNGITLDNSLLVFIQSEALLQWLGPLGHRPMSRYLLLIPCLESWYLNLLNVTKQWCILVTGYHRIFVDIEHNKTVCIIIGGMNRQLQCSQTYFRVCEFCIRHNYFRLRYDVLLSQPSSGSRWICQISFSWTSIQL